MAPASPSSPKIMDTTSPPISPTSQTMPIPSTSQHTIILHDSGDAILQVGPQTSPQPMLISKSVMALASPVWAAMFSRQKAWSESTAKEIPFPDDNINAMLLVLRIAHLRFREIPGKHGLSYQELLALAVVCDKYDLVKLVRPFLDLHSWADPHRPKGYEQSSWEPSWLFVAWTFGFGESFEPLAKYLVRNIELESDGTPRLGEGRYVVEEELPVNYLDRILRFRRTTLTALTTACYDILDLILSNSVCKFKGWEHLCRPMILGSYVEFLIKNNLYPVKVSGGDINMSIKAMEEMLRGIKIQAYSHGLNHTACSYTVNLAERVDKIVEKMESPVLECHLRHMEEQAKK